MASPHPNPLPQILAPPSAPQLALCLWDEDALEPVARIVRSASSGMELTVGTELAEVLAAVNPADLRLLVVDAHNAMPGALEALASVCPRVSLVVITDGIGEGQLASARRLPRLLGYVARIDGRIRPWELGYLVRRVVTPHQAVPWSHELLPWYAATYVFRPRTERQLELVPRAIELASVWCGMPPSAAALAEEAAKLLLANAIAAAEGGSQPVYDPHDDAILAEDDSGPTLRLAVDADHLAIDCSDPAGRLTREHLLAGLIQRGAAGTLLDPTPSAAPRRSGRGFLRLFYSAAVLRVEVAPGRESRVTWIHDRRIGRRSHQGQARSLYFLGG